jgi:carbamoyltransferase
MNLVGFGLTVHDSSVAAYKNGKFLYRKAERQFKSKHAHGDMHWAKSVLDEWDIDDFELAVSTWLSGNNSQDFIRTVEGIVYIDHHYSHLLSSSIKQCNNLVLDSYSKGPADVPDGLSPYTGLQNKTRVKELSPSQLLTHMIKSSSFDHEKVTYSFEEIYDIVINKAVDSYQSGKDPSLSPEWPLFVKLIDIPGKVMGLQAYGKPMLNKVSDWLQRTNFRNLQVSSEIAFMPKDEMDINFISTVHRFCEELVLEKTAGMSNYFSYSGGLAQNVVWNRAMLDRGLHPHIDPWAYDGGCSIGALHYLLDKHDIERPNHWEQDDEAPLGEPDGPLFKQVAQLLAQNKVVGWYQGNGEVGPRALGNRSVLFNPMYKENKDRVNKIKNREWWRPFGASVKEDEADRFFDLPISRHMLFNSNVRYSAIPAVTHVDATCRHQTVPETNHTYYWMLDAFEQETGLPVLGNTSLNKKGKPICSTVEEALDIFKTSELDAICIGGELYQK